MNRGTPTLPMYQPSHSPPRVPPGATMHNPIKIDDTPGPVLAYEPRPIPLALLLAPSLLVR